MKEKGFFGDNKDKLRRIDRKSGSLSLRMKIIS